ncbi:DUF488 domain-containing protein [Pseudidiomarina insulisalsae]|uniref:DUF488 domain-containing protein n=1 Tax=Pseudidiomarina insulisalsae TaxID=575789 RepID=A0A432YDG2_9GAMM|nr:DUF488 family protein [Pseudidiomarina insulisalsae]RUO59004.1 hypothetical protein CWI71_09290 [Pseudidiomarina insulisalsae]
MKLQTKRIYDAVAEDDGYRVLIDRLWPRGLAKDEAQLDDWLKSVAPSDDLRQWFHDNPSCWAEFRNSYLAELKEHQDSCRELAEKAKSQQVTLLYASKDREHNNAVVLAQYLKMLAS